MKGKTDGGSLFCLRVTDMRDGLEDEICAVMSECVYPYVGFIMAILTSDEATPSLNWRASLCISLMFCYAKIPYGNTHKCPMC